MTSLHERPEGSTARLHSSGTCPLPGRPHYIPRSGDYGQITPAPMPGILLPAVKKSGRVRPFNGFPYTVVRSTSELTWLEELGLTS